MERTRTLQGVPVPAFFYGTAWKEERTEELTRLALGAGFVAIDTANQRRHYFEAAVGDAVAASGIARASLFLQTKFTHVRGHDARISYDPAAEPATQVAQSFASSLSHLRTSYVDSYVLHGPSAADGLSETDKQAWRAMSALHAEGKTRLLGVSNVSYEASSRRCAKATGSNRRSCRTAATRAPAGTARFANSAAPTRSDTRGSRS